MPLSTDSLNPLNHVNGIGLDFLSFFVKAAIWKFGSRIIRINWITAFVCEKIILSCYFLKSNQFDCKSHTWFNSINIWEPLNTINFIDRKNEWIRLSFSKHALLLFKYPNIFPAATSMNSLAVQAAADYAEALSSKPGPAEYLFMQINPQNCVDLYESAKLRWFNLRVRVYALIRCESPLLCVDSTYKSAKMRWFTELKITREKPCCTHWCVRLTLMDINAKYLCDNGAAG